jgi:hypothetical protein
MSDFKQKIMAAAEFNFAPNTIDEYSRVYALLTRLVDEVEVLKAALSSASKGFESHWCNDGEPCPLCDSKEDAEEAVIAHQKRWEDLK